MKVKLKNGEIRIYDSIQDLPAWRFMEFNRNLALDAGVGSDLSDLADRISRISQLITVNPDMANQELENLHLGFTFVMNNISPRNNAFVSLIHSVDGVALDDIDMSDTGKSDLIKKMSSMGLTEGQIQEVLEQVKKK